MKDILAHPSDMGPGTFLFAAGMEQESNVAKPVQKSASDLMQDTLNSGGLKTTTLNWKAQHGRQLQGTSKTLVWLQAWFKEMPTHVTHASE